MSSSPSQENLTGNEIPYGTYEIKIGDSFNDQMVSSLTPNFHILRCNKYSRSYKKWNFK